MESFYVDLNETSSKKPKIRKLLIFGAIVCLTFIPFSLSVFLTIENSLGWFFLASAFYIALYFYFTWLTYKTVLFIKADTYRFEYKFGLLNRSKNILVWDTISKVKIGPAYIRFFKRSGRRRTVYLNWLPYSKVIEIKELLIKMLEHKKIHYEKAEIIDYSIKKDKEDKKEK